MQYKITSDLHINHKSILKFYPKYRNFNNCNDLESMNNGIIDLWNRSVNYDDTIYHLGDFAFANEKFIDTFLSKLNGNKIFILGNHDRKIKNVLKNHGKVYQRLNLRFDINSVQTQIVLDHYPLLEWDGYFHGSLHFYGHCHGTKKNLGRSIDVGYDVHGKILDIKEAIELAYLNNSENIKVDNNLKLIKFYEG